jgi:hypothetical protein
VRTGAAAPFPDLPAFRHGGPPEFSKDPARYGFHATLKAPFHLREGRSESELHALVRAFAEKREPLDIGPLDVVTLSRFLALCPRGPIKELAALAADCVTYFDDFRAPTSEADRARRLKSPLTERQLTYLDAWGYPYVLEEFRFHMTLASPLEPAAAKALQAELAALWKPQSTPITIDALTIAHQPQRDGPFIAQVTFPLGGKL